MGGVPEPVELFKTFEIDQYTFWASGVVCCKMDGDGGCETVAGEMALCECKTLGKLGKLFSALRSYNFSRTTLWHWPSFQEDEVK